MIDKRAALYVGHPVGGERCRECSMFRDPDRCTLVAGLILPSGHCQHWEPEPAVKIAKSFAEVIKDEPSASDVHVGTALGNQAPPRRRYRPFSAFVSGGPKKPSDGPVITATAKRYATAADLPKPVRDRFAGKPKKLRQWMHVWNGEYDAHGDEKRAFATAWAAVQKRLPGPTAPPFPTDLGFLSRLHGPQVPSFLWALTHRDALPKARVPLGGLVAIQDRVNPADVAADEKNPPGQRPTVVKLHGAHYIADGHDRLSARLLSGKADAKVRLHDMDHPVDPEAVKKDGWSTPFRIEKADPDKQQLFGWASVVTKNGRPVIDKQNDIIPVDELEKAAYDFVLGSRKQGDMHSRTEGVGRLIESMVFSVEKQQSLGIDLGMEGWWVGFQCDCKDLWKDVRSGKKLEFSIGGAAISEKVGS